MRTHVCADNVSHRGDAHAPVLSRMRELHVSYILYKHIIWNNTI